MDPRIEPRPQLPEREHYDAWLDYHRATLAWKCEGLTDAQLKERAVPPSPMSLLGLVRHMADVELNWFRRVINREPIVGGNFWTPENSDDDPEFDVADASVDEAFMVWREECDRSRAIAAAKSLDDYGERHGIEVDLRWVYVHMIEEYARHNGHADLLRERIDGQTGD